MQLLGVWALDQAESLWIMTDLKPELALVYYRKRAKIKERGWSE